MLTFRCLRSDEGQTLETSALEFLYVGLAELPYQLKRH